MNTIEFIAIVIVSLILCSTFGLSVFLSDIEERIIHIEDELRRMKDDK